MSNKQYRSSRLSMNNNDKYIKSLIHNLRMEQKTHHRINDNINFLYYKNENIVFKGQKDKKVLNIYDNLKNDIDKIREEHKELHNKNKKYSFNSKKQQSFTDGILYFSDSMNEIFDKSDKNKNMIWNKGIKTIQEIRKELDTEVLYITLHTDEGYIRYKDTQETVKKGTKFNPNTMEKVRGTIHFQYGLKGFNSLGSSINFKKREIGEKIQDISYKEFEELGFNRGEKKSETGIDRKYLTVDEFQEFKRTKTIEKELNLKVKQLLKENETLKEENKTLESVNNDYINENELLRNQSNQLKDGINELNKKFTELYEDLLDIEQEKTRETLVKKVGKYFKSENIDRLNSTIQKYKEIYLKELRKKDIETQKLIQEQKKKKSYSYSNDFGM